MGCLGCVDVDFVSELSGYQRQIVSLVLVVRGSVGKGLMVVHQTKQTGL